MPAIIYGYNVSLLTFIAMFSHDALGRMAEDLVKKIHDSKRWIKNREIDEIYVDVLSLVQDHPIRFESASRVPGHYGSTGLTVDDLVRTEIDLFVGI